VSIAANRSDGESFRASPCRECGAADICGLEEVTMGVWVYTIKAPIGWSLFRDRQRLGSRVSAEAALQAATKPGARDIPHGSVSGAATRRVQASGGL
jgi:hypothetical protein